MVGPEILTHLSFLHCNIFCHKAVINDEKLDGDDLLLTDEIAEDALNAMRFLPGEVTSAIETSLARVYDVDADELAELLFPED